VKTQTNQRRLCEKSPYKEETEEPRNTRSNSNYRFKRLKKRKKESKKIRKKIQKASKEHGQHSEPIILPLQWPHLHSSARYLDVSYCAACDGFGMEHPRVDRQAVGS
jgi:hypothetical protein